MIAAIIGSAVLGLSLGLRYRVGALFVAAAFLVFLIALGGPLIGAGLLSIASIMGVCLATVQIAYLAGSLLSGLAERSSKASVSASVSLDPATMQRMHPDNVLILRRGAKPRVVRAGKPS